MNNKEELLKLQRDFEANKITENDMSKEEIMELNKLYDEQISLLNEMENMYKTQIERYKEDTKRKLEELNKQAKPE